MLRSRHGVFRGQIWCQESRENLNKTRFMECSVSPSGEKSLRQLFSTEFLDFFFKLAYYESSMMSTLETPRDNFGNMGKIIGLMKKQRFQKPHTGIDCQQKLTGCVRVPRASHELFLILLSVLGHFILIIGTFVSLGEKTVCSLLKRLFGHDDCFFNTLVENELS